MKRTKDTTTRVRVHIDRAVLETPQDERSQASSPPDLDDWWRFRDRRAVGGSNRGSFVPDSLPGRASVTASLGPEAQCFRGSVMVPGRKRPVRHLVAVSAELAKTKPGADRDGARTILCDDDPAFVLYRVASRYGLPVVPDWAPWFMRELNQRKSLTPLVGLGCSPVLVKGNKQTFLKWIGRALRERLIRIPEENGSVSWKLPRTFLEQSNLQQSEGPQLTHDTVGRSG